jgi:hypothetical protein
MFLQNILSIQFGTFIVCVYGNKTYNWISFEERKTISSFYQKLYNLTHD